MRVASIHDISLFSHGFSGRHTFYRLNISSLCYSNILHPVIYCIIFGTSTYLPKEWTPTLLYTANRDMKTASILRRRLQQVLTPYYADDEAQQVITSTWL